MQRVVLLALLVAGAASCSREPSQPAVSREVASSEARAAGVTIVRDDWGIPHVSAKTDADAVFGLMYAQAEDDFNRVETNFLNALGRLAEAEGEKEIYRDLRMKLFIDPVELKQQYAAAPGWLKALMDAWADGLNFYLHTHPGVKPRVITKFEPWMALSFSEGSIGGDIERVSIPQLEAFYGKNPAVITHLDEPSYAAVPSEPTGSNGFAVAPANTVAGKALLFINPHTSFFFREEAHVTSEEGLNAYGAITWGQFFVYQGFNERAGWMHTSSGADNIDEFALTTVSRGGQVVYIFGGEERPVTTKTITVPFKTAGGSAEKTFTVYRTHHGPVVRAQDGKWIAVRMMEEPLKALQQSYRRTKARNLAQYKEVMALHTNSSNNTVYADADGTIAYFHSNFVPKRNPGLDWTRPVDGSVPGNDWQGIHSFDETPNVVNPPNGWIQNTNNWPYSAAGANSPKASAYPTYFDRNGENPRGIHAIRLFGGKKDFTIDTLRDAAFDSLLVEFEAQLPPLIRAWDQAPASNPLKARLADPIALLRKWNYRFSVDSVETALAVFWGDELWTRLSDPARAAHMTVYDYMRTKATAQERLEALATACDTLSAGFGKWATAWGEINRFQRISPAIVHPFSDAAPSIPVAFASARWGSLASFGARSYNGSKRLYGSSGNSFVAAVEFGADGVRAKAVTAGGVSSDINSRHFNDQAERYATGNLREVYFYPKQLEGHIERTYKPGQ